jgi:hypothetical protein
VGAFHRRVTNDTPGRAISRSLIPLGTNRFRIPWITDCSLIPGDAVDYFMVAECQDGTGERIAGQIYVLHNRKIRHKWARRFIAARAQTYGNASCETLDLVYASLKRDIKDMLKDYPSLETLPNTAEPYSVHGSKTPADDKKSRYGTLPQIMQCNFTLDRRGVCTISQTGILRSPGAAIDDRNLPAEAGQQADDAFRFIRDLFHHHYHHRPSDDGKTETHIADYENSWVLHVERNLFRDVIKARQKNTIEHISSALGRLAYLKSFRRTNADLYEKGARKLPERNFDDLESSLNTQYEAANLQQQSTRMWTSGLFAIPFTAFVFLMSLQRPKIVTIVPAEGAEGAVKVTEIPMQAGHNVEALQQWVYAFAATNGPITVGLIAFIIIGYIRLIGGYAFKDIPFVREVKRFALVSLIQRGRIWATFLPTLIFILLMTYILFALRLLTVLPDTAEGLGNAVEMGQAVPEPLDDGRVDRADTGGPGTAAASAATDQVKPETRQGAVPSDGPEAGAEAGEPARQTEPVSNSGGTVPSADAVPSP